MYHAYWVLPGTWGKKGVLSQLAQQIFEPYKIECKLQYLPMFGCAVYQYCHPSLGKCLPRVIRSETGKESCCFCILCLLQVMPHWACDYDTLSMQVMHLILPNIDMLTSILNNPKQDALLESSHVQNF